MYSLPIYPRDRSPIRALIFIPALIVIGLMPVVIAWILGSAISGGLELIALPGGDWFDHFDNRLRNGMIWGQGLGAFAGQLPVFFSKTVLLVIALWLLKRMYQRPIKSWLTTAPHFRFGHFAVGLLLTSLIVGLIMIAWGYASLGSNYAPRFLTGTPWQVWLALLGLAVITCLNAFGEEVLFRGWAMQQTAAFIRHPAVIIGLPALAFALFHREFEPLRLAQLMAMGLTLGWATWRLGGLELAAGAHGGFNLVVFSLMPTRKMPIPNPEQVAQNLGITVEQAARISYVLPPTAMDWVVYLMIALVPAAITEAEVWWQKTRPDYQGIKVSVPSS